MSYKDVISTLAPPPVCAGGGFCHDHAVPRDEEAEGCVEISEEGDIMSEKLTRFFASRWGIILAGAVIGLLAPL